MKLLIFAVYDAKAEFFSKPVFHRAQGEALRAFEDEVESKESLLGQHPGDFTLYWIGEYNQENGELYSQEPVSFGTGLQYLTQRVFNSELDKEA